MSFNLRFQKSGLLEDIALRLSTHQPNINQVVKGLRHRDSQRMHLDYQSIHGYLGEMYVRASIKEIKNYLSNISPSLRRRIKLNYFPENTSPIFSFRRSRTQSVVATYNDIGNMAEYDYLFKVDDLLIVCEVKLTKDNKQINSVLKRDNIQEKFYPLLITQDPDTSFGYMVVIPKEKVNPRSLNQAELENAGGIITPFPMSLQKWKDFVFKEIIPVYRMKSIGF